MNINSGRRGPPVDYYDVMSWPQDTLSYRAPSFSQWSGSRVHVFTTRVLIITGAVGIQLWEEAVLERETSLGYYNDGDGEILNGPIDERWYHTTISHDGIIP